MSARAARRRRPRTVRGSLAAIVLSLEFVVVFLAALVVFGLRQVPPAAALGGGGALLLLVVVAGALARTPAGIVLGWVVQVLLVAAVAVEPVVGIVGLIFAAMWVYCMIVGGRIDRREAAASPAE